MMSQTGTTPLVDVNQSPYVSSSPIQIPLGDERSKPSYLLDSVLHPWSLAEAVPVWSHHYSWSELQQVCVCVYVCLNRCKHTQAHTWQEVGCCGPSIHAGCRVKLRQTGTVMSRWQCVYVSDRAHTPVIVSLGHKIPLPVWTSGPWGHTQLGTGHTHTYSFISLVGDTLSFICVTSSPWSHEGSNNSCWGTQKYLYLWCMNTVLWKSIYPLPVPSISTYLSHWNVLDHTIVLNCPWWQHQNSHCRKQGASVCTLIITEHIKILPGVALSISDDHLELQQHFHTYSCVSLLWCSCSLRHLALYPCHTKSDKSENMWCISVAS